jgi:hypothetical protein
MLDQGKSNKGWALALALALGLGLGACDKGPAQKAGESLDHAASTATTSVDNAAKDVKQGLQGH